MAPSKAFLELLDDFAQTAGMETCPLDERGICSLVFDEKLIVNIGQAEARDEVWLFSPLGHTPDENRLAHFTAKWQRDPDREAHGMSLNFDQDGTGAVLSAGAPIVSLDGTRFGDWLETFLDTAETWQAELEGDGPQDDPQGETPERSDPPPFGLRA
ncbi:Type III secretion system chaperone [Sulfidibacter corallicola]|uniref:Type III secretion system chaperone n=1 Tax=Sulfidibacter corallicola TaxID=2818388 RepID=A0A8A4TJC0_SULCO|nr:type III secretion system chaperone [Sulfidibacter corallicola]QTD49693.1 type III secretion system chaperone [Sulfidibacter corallicola]